MSIEKQPGNTVESQEGNEGWLKNQSLDLTSVHLSGLGERADRLANYAPGEWNEQNGIIMYADSEGAVFATPAIDAVREKIMADPSFVKVEGRGVLNLNDSEMVWGGKEKNESNTAFDRWTELALRARGLQEAESAQMRAEQDAAREEYEKTLDS
jgi:hypothetical protein